MNFTSITIRNPQGAYDNFQSYFNALLHNYYSSGSSIYQKTCLSTKYEKKIGITMKYDLTKHVLCMQLGHTDKTNTVEFSSQGC